MKENFKRIFIICLSFLSGSLLLCAFSLIQKINSGFPIKISGFYVPFFFGGITGVILEMAYHQLQIANLKYYELFNQTQDAIILVNMDRKIIQINQAALKMFEYDENELIGTNLSIICQSNLSLDQMPNIFNSNFLKKSGKVFPAEVRTNKIQIHRNLIYQKSFHDLTYKNFLEENRIKNKKLESITFLAKGVAHDFKNISSIILSNLSIIKEDIQTENFDLKEINENIQECMKAAKNAAEITNQLQIIGKTREIQFNPIKINETIEESVKIVLRNTKINYNIIDNSNNIIIQGDSSQIKQVIINLLINAIQAIKIDQRGIITISIDLGNPSLNFEDDSDNKYCKVTLSDNGIGIPSENLTKIFEPYFTTKTEGQGLGLAICQKIIQEHMGYITVDSKMGEGTIFTIFFPIST